jgi:hypothetical protein
MFLDQTISAAANKILFSTFIHSIKAAMARPLGSPLSTPDKSFLFLTRKGAINYNNVNWKYVVKKSQAEFPTLMLAGWRLWPFVSLINFAFVKGMLSRNLVKGVAGLGWGIYMSLVAAR